MQRFEISNDLDTVNSSLLEWRDEDYENEMQPFRQFRGESTFDESEYTSVIAEDIQAKYGEQAEKQALQIMKDRTDSDNIHVAIDRNLKPIIDNADEEIYSSVWRQKEPKDGPSKNKNKKSKPVL